MDQSFMIILSNLLHLQNHLDPASSLFSTASSPSTLLSSSAAPLLFFTIASVLSCLTTLRSSASSSPISTTTTATSAAADENPSDYSVAAFRAFSTERIWAMETPLRDAQWRSSYGLSYPVFTTIVEKLKPYIALSNLSLPSDYAVAMVLSRLAHGLSAQTLAHRYSLEPYLVSKITNMVTRLLATKLYPEFIKIPVGHRRLHETTLEFEELTSLPNICGAIDGSPIKLHKTSPVTSQNGCSSVLLQVVADNKKIFWDVCVKAVGSVDDATHLRDSLLYNRLTMADVVWDKVVSLRGRPVRPYIVGDSSYPLLSFLLTPFSSDGSGSSAQNLFDAALMKARMAVVEAIGLLKGRWRILQDLNVGMNHAPQTIVACCVLHNLCQVAREPEPEVSNAAEDAGPVPAMLEHEMASHYAGENLRQALADDLHRRFKQER